VNKNVKNAKNVKDVKNGIDKSVADRLTFLTLFTFLTFFTFFTEGWGDVREERVKKEHSRSVQTLKVNGVSKRLWLERDRRGIVVKAEAEGVPLKSMKEDVPGEDIPGVPRPPRSVRALSVRRQKHLTVAYRCAPGTGGMDWYQSALAGGGWQVMKLSGEAVWAEQPGEACYIVRTGQATAPYVVMVYLEK